MCMVSKTPRAMPSSADGTGMSFGRATGGGEVPRDFGPSGGVSRSRLGGVAWRRAEESPMTSRRDRISVKGEEGSSASFSLGAVFPTGGRSLLSLTSTVNGSATLRDDEGVEDADSFRTFRIFFKALAVEGAGRFPVEDPVSPDDKTMGVGEGRSVWTEGGGNAVPSTGFCSPADALSDGA